MSEYPSNYIKLSQDEMPTWVTNLESSVYGILDNQDKKQDRRHREIIWLTIVIGIIGIFQSIGNLYEPHEIWKKFPTHVSVGIWHPSMQEWRHKMQNDIFNGRYKISKVFALNKGGWMVAKIYEDNGSQDLIIGEFTNHICLVGESLQIQIRIDNEVHDDVIVRVSKDRTFLFLTQAKRWIKKIDEHDRFSVRIVDDCGERYDLFFETKGKIDFSFSPSNA